MLSASQSWLPRLLAALALLLALYYLTFSILQPLAAGDQVFLGHRFVGIAGWIVGLVHAFFLGWLALACWRRRSYAAWAVIGYCVYLIENVWMYSLGEGRSLFGATFSLIVVNGLWTAILLAVCRIVLDRRAVFDC